MPHSNCGDVRYIIHAGPDFTFVGNRCGDSGVVVKEACSYLASGIGHYWGSRLPANGRVDVAAWTTTGSNDSSNHQLESPQISLCLFCSKWNSYLKMFEMSLKIEKYHSERWITRLANR